MNPKVIRILAVLATLTACLMAIVAAINRGGTVIEQVLLVLMSVMMVLAVHFLPAISRRFSTWLLWTGCFSCAVFGHLTFLTHSSLNAVETKVLQSAQMSALQNQIAVTRESLNAISARPLAVVAAELAQTDNWKMRTALRSELEQARHAEALRDDLVRLSAAQTAVVTSSGDPVISRIATVTGFSDAVISVTIGMLFSVILELTGTLLWFEALKKPAPAENQPVTVVTTDVTTAVTTHHVTRVTEVTAHLAKLKTAVDTGACRPTVAAIRAYLNCSQDKAINLRRELLKGNGNGNLAV